MYLSVVFGLVAGQAAHCFIVSGRKVDCLGCIHHKQGAFSHYANNMGDGLRLRSIWKFNRLRRSRQQSHRLSSEFGR